MAYKLKLSHSMRQLHPIFNIVKLSATPEDCYETTKRETISYVFINLMENIQEYNMGKI